MGNPFRLCNARAIHEEAGLTIKALGLLLSWFFQSVETLNREGAMKTKLLFLTVVGLALSSASRAADYVFAFYPDNLLANTPAFPSGDKTTQDNARKLTSGTSTLLTWSSSFGQVGSVYDTPAYHGVSQPAAYNTYLNWVDGLGPNEGLASLDLLIAISGTDYATNLNSPFYRSWGPHLLASPNSKITATAPTSWTVSTTLPPQLANLFVGIEWSPVTAGQFIRPRAGNPAFSFSVTGLLWDDNNDGIGDRPAQPGDLVRLYFSSGNVVFDANGWGTRPGYAPFASDGSTTWEGVGLYQVPEPSPAWLLGLFLAVAAWRQQRRI
jgi:hypothetical protein